MDKNPKLKRGFFENLLGNIAANLNVGSINAGAKQKEVDRYQQNVKNQIDVAGFYQKALDKGYSRKEVFAKPNQATPYVEKLKSIIPRVKKVQAQERPSPTPTATAQPKQYTDHWQFIDQVVAPLSKKYQVPLSVAASQFAGEGRLKGLGAERNNFYNIAAYDSDPNQAVRYPTPEAGVEAYMKLMSGQYKLANGKTDTRYLPAYKLRNNPEAMLRKIKELGYASRPDYPEFIMSTPEWKKYHK